MDKELLNKSIYSVLINKYKKDCPEDHKNVENAGYKIEKYNGTFHVKNTKTNRNLWIECKRYEMWLERSTTDLRDIYIGNNENIKFDFVGYLNKPYNDAWHSIKNKNNYWTKLKINYDKLLFCKNRIKWKNEEILKNRNEIIKLSNSLENNIRTLVSYEYELKELRKGLGLERRKK